MKILEISKRIPIPVYIGAGILGFFLYKKGAEKREIKKRQKVYKDSISVFTVTDTGSGTSTNVNLDLSTTAGEIYDSLYNNDFFGWTEDETRAINALKAVPLPFIKRLSDTYYKLYEKDLKADLISALDSDEWAQVSFLFK